MAAGPKPHQRVFDTNGRLIRYPLGPLVRDVSYDAADRISGYTHYDAATGGAQGNWNQSFSHDELGRLKNFVLPQTRAALSYDDNGNRSSISQGSTTRSYAIPATSNRLTGINNPSRSLTHDAVGNTKTDGNATFTYDLAGRLTTHAAAGVTTTYSYDNSGRRIRKHSTAGAGGTAIFVYGQQGELLGEYDSAGKPMREYVWMGTTPVAVFTVDPVNTAAAPVVYYIHADHIDTPRVVLDRSGNQRWKWMGTDPWGVMLPETNPSNPGYPNGLGAFTFNLRMPGQYADQESGLWYNWHRYYDPSTGRYAQADPIGLDGESYSLYAYVDNDPVSYVDPEGLTKKGGSLFKPPGMKPPRWSSNRPGEGKPKYKPNPAHDPKGPHYNPNKTPEPGDCQKVYEKAVPDDPYEPRHWWGRNEKMEFYRFHNSNDGTVHYSGTFGRMDRAVPPYVRSRLGW